MKKSRFSDEHIIGFLRQAEGGMQVKELCRLGGFSDATFKDPLNNSAPEIVIVPAGGRQAARQ